MRAHQNPIEEALIVKLRQTMSRLNDDGVSTEVDASVGVDQCLEKYLVNTLELAIFLQKMIRIRQDAKQKADQYTQFRKK